MISVNSTVVCHFEIESARMKTAHNIFLQQNETEEIESHQSETKKCYDLFVLDFVSL